MTRAVVFLHGFTGSPESFRAVVPELPADVAVFAPHLHGHGPTPDLSATSFEAEVARLTGRLDQWCAERKVSHLHLCGYSLGARVAQGLLVGCPDRFSSATLIGVHPGLTTEAERKARREHDAQLAADLRERGVQRFLSLWERQPLFQTQSSLHAEVLAAQRAVRQSHTSAGLASALDVLGLGVMPHYGELLARVPLPIRILAGERDEKFASIGRHLAATLQDVEVILAGGCGHNLLLEAPALVSHSVRAGLSVGRHETL